MEKLKEICKIIEIVNELEEETKDMTESAFSFSNYLSRK